MGSSTNLNWCICPISEPSNHELLQVQVHSITSHPMSNHGQNRDSQDDSVSKQPY